MNDLKTLSLEELVERLAEETRNYTRRLNGGETGELLSTVRNSILSVQAELLSRKSFSKISFSKICYNPPDLIPPNPDLSTDNFADMGDS